MTDYMIDASVACRFLLIKDLTDKLSTSFSAGGTWGSVLMIYMSLPFMNNK